MKHVPPDDDNGIKQSAQLLEQIQSHYQAFLSFQEEAKSAIDSLAREKESTPTQCTRFVRPLFNHDNDIITFCTLLQQTHLPDHISRQRHEILIVLQNISSSLDSLKLCIDAFTSGNSYSQGEGIRTQRATILNTTRILEQHLSAFNKALGAILNTPSLSEKIGNDKNFDRPSECTKEPHEQRTKPVPTDRTNLPERQQSSLFTQLYELLKMYTNDLDLREICRSVGMNYNRLNPESHAARAFSLTEQLDNENRLQVLETELRHRLPGRFQEPPPSQ